MRYKAYIAIVLALFFINGASFPAHAKEFDYKSKEFKAVASQFSCTCGCGQDHFECDPNTCNLTVEFKKDLVDMMNKGMDKDEIRKYYIGIYGEEILTAPEKEGFSLTAWVLPFVALGGAGTALFFVIRKWVGKKGPASEQLDETTGQDEVENEILSSIIDEERKKYL
ncbi:cytochrome c-type biogenesis protein [Bacillus sp. FJAT-27445]|uniref:cytochrome c-type biogenesis protein n=1 Tax=Bacillus sp. FJAT-27445 TaxID=1679166 RepID=UPI0007439520|nr:cytochrome c-type biogenesis protein [Bacillus sp. FJAT-27445]